MTDQRRIAVLRHAGHSWETIAALLGTDAATVKAVSRGIGSLPASGGGAASFLRAALSYDGIGDDPGVFVPEFSFVEPGDLTSDDDRFIAEELCVVNGLVAPTFTSVTGAGLLAATLSADTGENAGGIATYDPASTTPPGSAPFVVMLEPGQRFGFDLTRVDGDAASNASVAVAAVITPLAA